MLTDDEIGKILAGSDGDPDVTGMVLSERVRRAGAHDNYTFVILRIAERLPEPETHPADEVKESDYLLRTAEERVDHA